MPESREMTREEVIDRLSAYIKELLARIEELKRKSEKVVEDESRARISELERERDEARDLLKSPAEACLEERGLGSGGCGACSICCGALRSEVERLRAESAWVPCSERMPEAEGDYLCSFVNGFGEAWVAAGYWRSPEWVGQRGGKVVAWAPLPAPYTQEDSNAPS